MTRRVDMGYFETYVEYAWTVDGVWTKIFVGSAINDKA